ncbi:MAG: T9SS type A sorting domain-containing protein, partial [Bacteroidia bacterium]
VRTYVVRSSADSFVANLPASISPANANLIAQPGDIFFFNADNSASQTGSTITLSGVNFTDLTLPITFRFYAYNAEGTGGNFSLNNVVVSGNINTLSIADNNIEGLKMYPNPVSGNTLYLTSTNNLNMSVQIFDLLGKEVIKSNVINNTINVANLQAGVYVVKIT